MEVARDVDDRLQRVPRQIFQIPSLTYLDLRGNSKLPGMIHQASTSTADVVKALREEEGGTRNLRGREG